METRDGPFNEGTYRLLRVAQGALIGTVITGALVGHNIGGVDPSYTGSGVGALLICLAFGFGWIS